MNFWLGTHQPHWLARYNVPMMVSRRTLAPRKSRPVARCRWMRDSGGFTELQLYGSWQNVPVDQSIEETRRDRDEVGNLAYCAPQDWMCEPIVIHGGTVRGVTFAGTKLSVPEHQRRTVANFVALSGGAPDLPWLPVLQGWELDDYLRCIEMYERAGVDLWRYPLVGVGTICRRQGTKEGKAILKRLAAENLPLHAFGLKTQGIPDLAPFLHSSDSLAWSMAARFAPPLPGCTHKNCANCWKYAEQWLGDITALIGSATAKPCQSVMAL